jgi:hypothetical protein
MDQLSRRGVLRSLGVAGVGISAGCASVPFLGDTKNNEHAPGALVVSNRHSLAHVVGVSVSVPESVESDTVNRDVLLIMENGLEGQIPVDAGETKVYPDFLSGSVMYTVKMWLDSSDRAPADDDERQTAEFSPAAIATSDNRGAFLTIEITRIGDLSWHVTYIH